jgi:hypothetical protein
MTHNGRRDRHEGTLFLSPQEQQRAEVLWFAGHIPVTERNRPFTI